MSTSQLEEKAYRNLNQYALKQITKALDDDPSIDLEPVVNKLHSTYAKYRQAVPERVVRQQERRKRLNEPPPSPPPPKVVRPTGAVRRLMLVLQLPNALPERPFLDHGPLPTRTPFSCPLPHVIVRPFSPTVLNLLGIIGGHPADLSSVVVSRVFSGKMVWESGVRAVIQISPDVAVKVTRNIDPDEHDIMRYLEERIPAIPAPRALGLVTVGATAFMFMTLIPGSTLEVRWSSLSLDAKTKIRGVLDANLLALRAVELPPGEPFGTPVGKRLCVDVRYEPCVAPSPIFSEAEFNDFLMHRPSSRVAPDFQNWLRSMLREDHRILLTHGDFHPRNVMVTDGDDPELTGIIDWEYCGFYPEHWEQVKALNTRGITDTSDWWDHLPPCILGYDQEVVLDRYIELTLGAPRGRVGAKTLSAPGPSEEVKA